MPSRPVIYVSISDESSRAYIREMGARFLPVVCDFCFVDEPGSRQAEASKVMRAKMGACDAVVHLVGAFFGRGPEDPGGGGGRRSFAQMEFDLAVELAKPLHIALLEGDLAEPTDEPKTLRLLQERHRAAVQMWPYRVETIRSRLELKIYLQALAERLRGTAEPDPSATSEAGCAPPLPAAAAAEVFPEAASSGQPFPAENVIFTAYRPETIRPGQWEKLLFFAHLDEAPDWMDEDERTPIEEMEAQAAGILGHKLDWYHRHSGDSRFPVPRDGELTLAPEMVGVEFDPPRRSFFWREGVAVHGETFRLRAAPALGGGIARGRITVFLGALILAEIGLAIRVGGDPAKGAGTRKTSAAPFRKIFASYSHRDVEVVETLERHARTLGDEYLRDWMHLRSGEQWDARLLSLVEQADVFQLFWSNHSACSPFVEREWRHALRLGREAFVRPTYWEHPMPPPPPDLAGIHFHLLNAALPSPVALTPPAAPAVPRLLVKDHRKETVRLDVPAVSARPLAQATVRIDPALPPAMSARFPADRRAACLPSWLLMALILAALVALILVVLVAGVRLFWHPR